MSKRNRATPGDAEQHLRDALFLEALPFGIRAARSRFLTLRSLLSAHGIDSADLEQEVLLGLWRALPSFRESRASLRTFVDRVAANIVTTQVRRLLTSKRKIKEQSVVPERGDFDFASIDLRLDLQRALKTLDGSDLRITLCLGLKGPEETSKELGVSRASIYRGIQRVRRKFTEFQCEGSGRFVSASRK